ncbi:uncharacterized protein BO97DRAFT_229731 [Aspergillus homomorphus CBS 101889]|uniref:Secreted protein n=1 Tax=Aspergillus homomorphus (strain CBS 101889) TaxID=1450537 RepID=A0A395HJ85_ASPHC|nr:hypothetical protein BO97DRAFT_229731 [Aspergillus homomorphus CBS 101889]RAL07981.1 hypothetical protein BO97DRAFT_229731 [Aspergillus homomorphus CBS 101889]
MNCIRYMCPVLIFFVSVFRRLSCLDLKGHHHRLFNVTWCSRGKRNTQKYSPDMVSGETLDIQKWSAGIVSYTYWPLFFCLSCSSLSSSSSSFFFLHLCSVAGNASLNIISNRHDHHRHPHPHHHQLSLSIYQHSRVPGEWVYCFYRLLIITCIPRLFHVCVFVL